MQWKLGAFEIRHGLVLLAVTALEWLLMRQGWQGILAAIVWWPAILHYVLYRDGVVDGGCCGAVSGTAVWTLYLGLTNPAMVLDFGVVPFGAILAGLGAWLGTGVEATLRGKRGPAVLLALICGGAVIGFVAGYGRFWL